MPLAVPPELKKITNFVRRAEELDRDKSNPESRVVAYYCRQYAVQAGIPLATTAAGKQCLGGLLGQLETEKSAMSVFSPDESKLICRRFADRVFAKADGEDRAGAADKGTARTFYAAASFFEILQQFYDKSAEENEKTPEEEEEAEKRVYCKWKATEILKAIREGRKPTPGGYGEDADDAGGEEGGGGGGGGGADVPQATGTDEATAPAAPETPDIFVPPPPPASFPSEREDSRGDEGMECGLDGQPKEIPPPAYPGQEGDGGDADEPPPYRPPAAAPPPPSIPPPPMPAPAYEPRAPAPKPAEESSMESSLESTLAGMFGLGKKKKPSSGGGGRVSKAALADATELTKFALAALEEKNTDLAAQRLQQALSALGR